MYLKKLALLILLQATLPLMAVNYEITLGTDSAVTEGGNPGELRYVLNSILNDQAVNMTPTDRQIIFAADVNEVTLNGLLPMINLFQGDSTEINVGGTAVVINGNGFRPFFVVQGDDITLENLIIINSAATGGTGGTGGGGYVPNLGGGGGGGGMGAGGAIFVDRATVTLRNVSFIANSATGGAGGTVSGSQLGAGGGGGLGGSGGAGFSTSGAGGGGYSGNGGNAFGNAGGGGGGFGNGGDSGASANNGGGGGGGAIIGANGGDGNGGDGSGVTGFVFGGGGAGGSADDPVNGGAGGGTLAGSGGTSNGGGGGGGYSGTNGDAGPNGTGGLGGMGGGGGGASGSYNGNPGAGGLGGGSGGAGAHSYGAAGGYGAGGGGFGVGGFGGGGGGGSFGMGGFGGGAGGGDLCFGGFGGGGGGGFGAGFAGLGGVGAGIGSTEPGTSGEGGGGGGGAGFGGAIFLNTGTVIIAGQGFFVGSNLTAGAPGTPASKSGSTAGSDIFLVSGANLTFTPGGDEKVVLSGTIADDSSNSVPGGSGITAGTGAGGSITKNGLGTLSLKGINTYIGGTLLNAGTLVVDGSITGSLSSASGSTLRGTGTVGNVTLQGTIAPGDKSVGTMTASSISFESGSTLSIEIKPSESSLLSVTGSAGFTGPTVIFVSEDSGVYTSNTIYTVLESTETVTGTEHITIISSDPRYRFILDPSNPKEIKILLRVI